MKPERVLLRGGWRGRRRGRRRRGGCGGV